MKKNGGKNLLRGVVHKVTNAIVIGEWKRYENEDNSSRSIVVIS